MLLRGESDRAPQLFRLPVFRLGDYKIAAVPSWDPSGNFLFVGLGIELATLRRLETMLFGQEDDLLEFEGLPLRSPLERVLADREPVPDYGGGPNGSLMPDGTFFGRLPVDGLLGTVEFKL